MNFKLKVWRQKSAAAPGRMVEYEAKDIPAEASLLEMLDIVNEELIERNEEPIAFEHDCREGICGSCGMMIDGKAHAGMHTATCQIHMREFRDGSTIALEPFRARAFPVIQDLVVDRAPFDKIIQAGGFVSVSTGAAQDANAIPIPKDIAEYAMDAAECIGCGACVAQCPNGAAQLFTAAKVSHLGLLPQGQPERYERVLNMVEAMERDFGSCTNFRECEGVCPKSISTDFIARLNRDFLRAQFLARKPVGKYKEG
jgi:succinate dehydrogenase / fumarate reductase, iron-sulfur subunit